MNTNQPPQEHKPKIIAWFLDHIWRWLIEPTASVQDTELRRKARLVSLLLLIIIPAVVIGQLAGVDLAFILVAVVAAYGLSRTKYYRLAAALTMGVLSLPSFIQMFAQTTYSADTVDPHFMWLALPLVLSSLLFSLRGTVIVAITNFISILLLPLFIIGLSFPYIIGSLGFIGNG